jgi:hypothetical protein
MQKNDRLIKSLPAIGELEHQEGLLQKMLSYIGVKSPLGLLIGSLPDGHHLGLSASRSWYRQENKEFFIGASIYISWGLGAFK